jgi:hypothetical protein
LVLDGLASDTAESTGHAVDNTTGCVCDAVKADAAEKVAATALLSLLTRLSSWSTGWSGELFC